MPWGVVAITAALLAGCFGPGLPGEIRCAEGLCPDGLVCDDGVCRPELTGDPDAATADAAADAAVDAAPVCATLDFTDVDDTILREDAPDTALGALETVEWDDQNADTGGGSDFGLIRFNRVFGSGADQVPPGAEIISATFTVVVVESGMGNPGEVRETEVDWDEDTTLNTFGGAAGIQAGDIGELVGEAPTDLGVASFDVADSATRGSAEGEMPGWIFLPDPGNPSGVQAASSEAANSANRPSLEIEFCD